MKDNTVTQINNLMADYFLSGYPIDEAIVLGLQEFSDREYWKSLVLPQSDILDSITQDPFQIGLTQPHLAHDGNILSQELDTFEDFIEHLREIFKKYTTT